MSGANFELLQSLTHELCRSWSATALPVEPKLTRAHVQLLPSFSSRKNEYGSTLERIVYVPPGTPVMSTHCQARYHSYSSPHPTLIPIRLLSAFGVVWHHEPR